MKEQDREYLSLLSVTFGHRFLIVRNQRNWDEIMLENDDICDIFEYQFIEFIFFYE